MRRTMFETVCADSPVCPEISTRERPSPARRTASITTASLNPATLERLVPRLSGRMDVPFCERSCRSTTNST